MNYLIVIKDREGKVWVDDVLYGGDSMSPDFVHSFAEERAHHGSVFVVEETSGRTILAINSDQDSV